jgi:hypothetical protein
MNIKITTTHRHLVEIDCDETERADLYANLNGPYVCPSPVIDKLRAAFAPILSPSEWYMQRPEKTTGPVNPGKPKGK